MTFFRSRTQMVLLSLLWLLLIQPTDFACSAATTKTVVDRSGAKVILPEHPDRILVTCYGGAVHEIALLGGAARVVGHPPIKFFPFLLKIYPEFSQLPDAGSFDNVNIESVMALHPDLVVASIISEKTNDKIRKLGIPVITVGTGRTNVDLLLREFSMMGEVLGNNTEATALISYWHDKLEFIQQKIAHVPEGKRKKVFYNSAGSPFKTEGSIGWGESFIDAAGGINVSTSVKTGGIVTPEQLMLWNPDVIVTSVNKIHSPGNRIDELMKLTSLTAVINHDIHYSPIGTFWWDRPSPEAILGILWLAKILYPTLFTDMDLRDETKNFFRDFYKYDLSDAEYASFYTR